VDEVNILPIYRIGFGEIKDGLLIKAHEYCLKRCREKCEKYYRDIHNIEGVHQCPNGFTSYVIKDKDDIEIFTAFRLEKHYDKRKCNARITKNTYNPILTDKQFHDIINAYQKTSNVFKLYGESTKFVNDIVHEIKNFNSLIVTKSELLMSRIEDASKRKKDETNLEISHNIFALSSLISLRYSVYDLTVNPEALKFGGANSILVHNKFFKIIKCYDEEARKRGISIKTSGSTAYKIEAYKTFSLLPFLLIDNAIKYSPDFEEILISFEENKNGLKIKIDSMGPNITKEELLNVFNKEFRSEAAKCTKISGSGIGLHLAQKICELHNININVDFKKENRKVKSIDYGTFIVELNFLKITG